VQISSHWSISTKGGHNSSCRTRPVRRTGEKITGAWKSNDGGDARSTLGRANGSDPLGLPIRFHGALLRRPAGRQRCPAMPRYQFSEAVARLPHCGCCGWRYRRRRYWDQHRTVSSNAGSRCPARCAAHAVAIHNAGTAFIHFADLPHGRGNIVRGYTTWRVDACFTSESG
jgi:hypothetical protein